MIKKLLASIFVLISVCNTNAQCATGITPVNNSTDVFITNTGGVNGLYFSWTPPNTASTSITYDFYLKTDPDLLTPYITQLTDANFSVPLATLNTTYYWKVVTFIDGIEVQGCPVYTFTTSAYDQCSGAVELNPGQDFNTGVITSSNIGATKSSTEIQTTCEALASYNKAKDVWYKIAIPPSGSITIETQAAPSGSIGNTVVSAYSGSCGALTSIACVKPIAGSLFGKINITGRTQGEIIYVRVNGFNGISGVYLLSAYDASVPVCQIPDNLVATNVTSSTATLSWSEISGNVNYEYVIDTSAANPTSNGIAATTNTVNPTNLIQNSTYYLHVRNNCGAYKSNWSSALSFTTLFTIPDCALLISPSDESLSVPITADSITLTWNAPATGIIPTSYDVFFGASSTSMNNIVNTTATSYTPTGIVQGTKYYWKIVSKNNMVEATGCPTYSFTTELPLSVNAFESEGFSYYPNPVTSILNLSNREQLENMTIYNSFGQELTTKSINNNNYQLDMSSYEKGVYLMKISANKQSKTIKIIKE